MNAKFESLFNTIETSRKQLFEELKQYSDETLNKKPSPTAWSAIQVIEHLMTSEEKSLQYLQKKTLDVSRSKQATFVNWLKLFLTKVAFDLPVKYNAPEAMMPPEGDMKLSELDKKWTQIRTDMFELLNNKLSDSDFNRELWKHAVAGKLNLYQMADFFDFHFNRHHKQIERTLAAVK